jgi:glutamate-5-semialdehyde dehydrogenase
MKLAPSLEKELKILKMDSRKLRRLSTSQKNSVLIRLAQDLEEFTEDIIKANQKDLKSLDKKVTSAFRDRLTLNPTRLAQMAESLRQVAKLPDPVGELVDERKLPNGLKLKRVRAPLGVIFMIFESRPNVIIEAFSLAFKSGNALILRGGSDSQFTSQAIYKIMKKTFESQKILFSIFCGIQNYDRKIVNSLLKRKDLIDIVVPRGGDKLIEFVQKESQMPIIKNDRGLCHAYIESDADLDMAVQIVTNSKTQRPGVCNALETVLVHKEIAPRFLISLYKSTESFKLNYRVDKFSQKILKGKSRVKLAGKKDYDTEYLDLILNVRVVEDLNQALQHIAEHGSGHSETIVTSSETKARVFQEEVDAAAVYWNASTRFTDGFEFGLGGELGISTQKLHVRGPVGLRELTTPRWIIDGQGQIRT